MQSIIGLFKLTRPFTSLTGALTTLVGGYVAGTDQWKEIILASIVTFLISASSIAWNDYLDVEIDRVNQPQRAIPSGEVSPRSAWIFSIVLTAVALIIAFSINFPAFLMALLVSLLLYFYSWKLKSTVLIGNITTAGIAALSAIFGGVAAGNVAPTLWMALIVFSAISGREVLKALADYEGDKNQGCKTVATVWGKPAARILCWLFVIISLTAMMLPYFLGIYKPIYAILVILGIYPVMIYIMIRVAKNAEGRQLERLSQFVKFYVMPTWFLAVYLGAVN